MTNVLKVILIADAHIGADKFDTHPDRWDAPVREAFNFAVDNKADLVISCGDFMHKRNPTIAELLRRRELLAILGDIPFWEVDGNHDRSNAAGSYSALEIEDRHPGRLFQGALDQAEFKGLNIIGLPWPRPVDYLSEEQMKLSIDEKIGITRTIILNKLTDMVRRPTEKPLIVFGHAMLAYGPVGKATEELAQDPGLILGKDVVLPYQSFIDAGLTENQIFMGHVHQRSKGYVGSTQPTDWGDWQDDKSFTELVIVKCIGGSNMELMADGYEVTVNGKWVYATKRHSYADQLKLHDIVLSPPDLPELKSTPIDVARVTLNLEGEFKANEEGIRELIENAPNYARLDRIIINHPEREATRVDTGETPLTDMHHDEVFAIWMEQSGYSADESVGPNSLFQELVEAAK